tara:strand:+ start:19 stop:417 length:399 start_codon:yes stop_codon:yes gene_type:complete
MSFLDSVITVLGVMKKGAELLDAVSPDKPDDPGFMVKPMRTQTKQTRPAPLKNMERILGLDMPQMIPVYKRFADSLSRDSQLASLQASNFAVNVDQFDSKIGQTMTLSDAATTRLSSSQSRTNKLLRNLGRG